MNTEKQNWTGKTKGSLQGYRIFVFLIQKVGLNAAYFLLFFVALHFALFARKSRQAQYYFYRKRLKFSILKSICGLLKNNFAFGQILIDKVAILSGMKHKFTSEHVRAEVIEKMIQNKTGGILLNAHMGGWEAAGQLLERYSQEICILMIDKEHEKIKNYLQNIQQNNIRIIPVKENGSHLLEISQILKNKGIIVMHGDRFIPGSSTVSHPFLGKSARFPTGAFHLAAKYQVPISFAASFRSKKRHYTFCASEPLIINQKGNLNDRKKELYEKSKLYVEHLEENIKKHPWQWFNFYNFWENNNKDPHNGKKLR